ncbi:outer membrane lipoprotein carrier protein [Bisgaardia hudsonensis]|uniref:Outer-membrane lipoprotein carrier protein n=1 Tax=Bisgaardia hudsonensis TaxID=109472 RepID=A0A4R2N1P4_9PAST|nr:outer membrane lipoprotein chaperone LolA [Bisgaardia hudsonensis]QLB12947.1 outer-membrane lipoprotein carrier protein LolA [Bisgaardia hudsonensis]TCP13492.1 outer membrane lipoprotein carrier protein [Bisgaardia hudsonensis]
MKKIAIKLTALLLIFSTNFAFADAKTELQSRLSKITELTADYTQKVSDPMGKEVQQGSGKLQIKRPNLFRMENKTPQETTIIADGKTLWFYDPFVEQVTINWVKEAINNTPFVLLTSTDTNHWQQYSITQEFDTFILKPKSAKSTIKQFNIRIEKDGVLKNFSTTEKDGQSNLYILRNITNTSLANKLFTFDVPKGVEVDDQRNK